MPNVTSGRGAFGGDFTSLGNDGSGEQVGNGAGFLSCILLHIRMANAVGLQGSSGQTNHSTRAIASRAHNEGPTRASLLR